ncbi:TetR/AcrR family transcriptional regulator [Actinomadura logoneensis]|uniref:TetR/AcrR family transcriptional regulator n=1 Tax=Actinomadura logoneensis TaxID=2293572 RepID=UPI001F327EA3|nr:TetR/AcrR family transcriptional regulator [Actinomadura logoneensis]
MKRTPGKPTSAEPATAESTHGKSTHGKPASGKRTRGQSAGLTRAAILEAALALADREGLKALSMRRIGQELGVEAMSLYQHVRGKDALLDGLVEQLFARVAPPPDPGGDWRGWLRGYAGALLDALLAHPRVVPLVATRPAVTPQTARLMESALGTLHAAGFGLERALDMLYAVTGFVVGHVAMLAADERSGGAADGRAQAPPALDPREVPLFAEALRSSRPAGSAARFGFALDALLRGFEAPSASSPASSASGAEGAEGAGGASASSG